MPLSEWSKRELDHQLKVANSSDPKLRELGEAVLEERALLQHEALQARRNRRAADIEPETRQKIAAWWTEHRPHMHSDRQARQKCREALGLKSERAVRTVVEQDENLRKMASAKPV